jgi:hypothetical protein
MKKTEWDSLFHEYALRVINNLQSDELSSTFSDYLQFLNDQIQSMPDWQIALPVIACLAAGGSVNDGIVPASAWVSLNLASEILDNVEDKELTTDHFLTSPEVASNFATGLILASFHALTSIKDASKARRIVKIFSGSAFDAVYGQHRDLLQNRLPVELFLNNYWEISYSNQAVFSVRLRRAVLRLRAVPKRLKRPWETMVLLSG